MPPSLTTEYQYAPSGLPHTARLEDHAERDEPEETVLANSGILLNNRFLLLDTLPNAETSLGEFATLSISGKDVPPRAVTP